MLIAQIVTALLQVLMLGEGNLITRNITEKSPQNLLRTHLHDLLRIFCYFQCEK